MAKKEKKENNKQKRRYFKDMKAELKKVIWPSAKQTANNTIAVIAFTLVIALIVFALDFVFDFANKKGVVALQEKIKSSYSVNNTTEESADENANTEESSKEENSDEKNATKTEVKTDDSANKESKK